VKGIRESGDFFTADYFRRWLAWINETANNNSSAKCLNDWILQENSVVRQLISDYRSRCGRCHVNLLDIGCGFGRHTVALLREDVDLTAVGVDINGTVIAEARRAIRRHGLESRASFAVADAAKLFQRKSNEFDIAICMTNTLGNLTPENRRDVMRGLCKVLRVSGNALLSVYSHASIRVRIESYRAVGVAVEERGSRLVSPAGLVSQSFSKTELRSLVETNGLRIEGDVEPLGEIGWFVIATL
jgi:SAM-dependent methyltransferase